MPFKWSSLAAVEETTVQPVPDDKRTGRPRHLLWIWFSINIMPLTLVTGVLGPSVYRLPLGWSIVAIVAGNLVGAIFMALHAAQGPQLGIPQMIQTRAQFGSYGALLVIFVVIFEGIGFASSIYVVGGQSLHALSSTISVNLGIVIVALLSVLVLVFGYSLFHLFNRAIVGLMVLGIVLAYAWALGVNGLPDEKVADLAFSPSGFIGMFSVVAVWQIAYAPYVSDYSRYMSPKHQTSHTFWTTYGGTVLGATVVMILGAIVGSVSTNTDSLAVVAVLTAGVAPFLLLVLFLGAADAGVINTYTPMLSIVTIVQTLRPEWRPRPWIRALISVALVVLCVLIAIFGKANFLANFTNFLLILLYLLAPWTAINLVDFYVLRHGSYDVASIMRADGGVYGKFEPIGIACYIGGFLVQIPFMNVFPIGTWPGYMSPVAGAFNGADISWLVGIGVTATFYYLLRHRARSHHDARAINGLRPAEEEVQR